MLQELTVKKFLKELASRKPVPGGGSVAALSGALAAGLVSMAAKFSGNKEISEKSRRLMGILTDLIDKDAEAFAGGNLKEATEVPLKTARYSYEVIRLAGVLIKDCNPRVASDVGVAAKMAESAVEGALLNVGVNLASIKDDDYQREILEASTKFRVAGLYAKAILNQIKACPD